MGRLHVARYSHICLAFAALVWIGTAFGAGPPPPKAPALAPAIHHILAHDWESVADLPAETGSLPLGWQYAKRLELTNPTSLDRLGEPVEVAVDFHAEQVRDPAREVRVFAVGDGTPVEVPSQVCCDTVEDDVRRTRLFFLADVEAQARQTFLILYGNPDAPAPVYDTDLTATGDGYALEVGNEHYRVVLAPTNGNLKSLYSKTGPAAFVGHGPPMMGAHGVEGAIHWGPDWSDELVGRYRLTNWAGPPHFDYDVVRGPVCVRVRRWGHPILAIGPEVGRPEKVVATVIYSFYAGQPYVIMESKMEVLEDIGFRDCRNDEWVLGGHLPEAAWMGPDGRIGFGGKGWNRQDPKWMTFYDPDTGEGFGSIHLAFENTNPNWPQPETVGIQDQSIWVRYPVRHAAMRAGEHVYEKNAYVLHRFEPPREQGQPPRSQGFGELVDHQQRLTRPLQHVEIEPAPKDLSLAHVLDALRATTDFELYIQGSPSGPKQLSLVDLGMVRDVAIDGDRVRVDLIMPYPGRDTWFGWYTKRIQDQIGQRLRGVGGVEVRQVHEPVWTPAQMTARAHRLLGHGDD